VYHNTVNISNGRLYYEVAISSWKICDRLFKIVYFVATIKGTLVEELA